MSFAVVQSKVKIIAVYVLLLALSLLTECTWEVACPNKRDTFLKGDYKEGWLRYKQKDSHPARKR